MEYLKNSSEGSAHHVIIEGEVKTPGHYPLRPGEKLSSMLLQAGGFTEDAYPYGTILTRPSVGRIVCEADYTILQVKPELDVLLEAGDHIVVPKRPLHVTVQGAVLNPASLQFVTGQYAQDYIKQAGGFSCGAQKSGVIITYPNGVSCVLPSAAWNYTPKMIPPGSVVTVPWK